MDPQLDRAVAAVNAALTALRRNPCSPGVAAALRQGADAVAQLPTNLTAVVLRRLIIAATDCHHDGVAHSARWSVPGERPDRPSVPTPDGPTRNTTPTPNPTRHGCPLPRPTMAWATRPASCRA
jgi:hypothetical protein